jgi:hypothetical protein
VVGLQLDEGSALGQGPFRDARDRRGHHHRAPRGLAASWMRVLWTCWSAHTPYDPTHHTTAMAALPTDWPAHPFSRRQRSPRGI